MAGCEPAMTRTRHSGSTGEPRPPTRYTGCSAPSRRCQRAATRDSRGPASNSRAHFNRLQRKHKQSCGLSAKTLVRLCEPLAEQVHDAGLVLGTRATPPPAPRSMNSRRPRTQWRASGRHLLARIYRQVTPALTPAFVSFSIIAGQRPFMGVSMVSAGTARHRPQGPPPSQHRVPVGHRIGVPH